MNRYLILVSLLIVSVSCNKELTEQVESNSDTQKVTLTANLSDGANTRVLADYSDDDHWSFEWEEGDAISAWHSNSCTNPTEFEMADFDGDNSTFSGALGSGDMHRFIYPHVAGVTTSADYYYKVDVSAQQGDLAKTYLINDTQIETESIASGTVSSLDMKHLGGFMVVDVYLENFNTDYTYTLKKVAYSSADNIIPVSAEIDMTKGIDEDNLYANTTPGTITAEVSELFTTVNEGIYLQAITRLNILPFEVEQNKSATITLTIEVADNGIFVETLSSEITLTNSNAEVLSFARATHNFTYLLADASSGMKITGATITDWVDAISGEGDVLDVELYIPRDYSSISVVNALLGTSDIELRLSNCYMVDPAEVSLYTIPIGSRINTYWGDSEYGNNPELQIGSDWTTNDTYTIEPLWNDFELADYADQITFTKVAGADDECAMQIKFVNGFSYEGNMVIAVKKGDTIVWSWHIWITDYNPYTKTNGTTYEIEGYGTWMDRNIGALSTAFSESNNLYYQWGRKDPLTSTVEAKDAVATIADAVKAPQYFYLGGTTSSSDYDWCGNGDNYDQDRDHHWRDAKLPSIEATSGDKYGTTKSIYDPSPLGFMVSGSLSTSEWSSQFAFMGITSDNTGDYSSWDSAAYGRTGSGVFFPASGYRSYSNGTLCNVDNYGCYWSASSAAVLKSFTFEFSSSNIMIYDDVRAYGCSVRPIIE